VAEGPVAPFPPALSNFAQYCNGGLSEAGNGSKEQFPASSFDGLPSWPQHRESRRRMRGFDEQLSVLGRIYRLVGEGFSDGEIAGRLRLSEPVVTNCIAWMLHSLKITDRTKLVADAFSATRPSTSEEHLRAS
jgi:DNA-binding CsgD family transcriptional regulator